MLYGHGDDFYNAKNEVKINFSSNVWHGANLDKLKEHLIEIGRASCRERV